MVPHYHPSIVLLEGLLLRRPSRMPEDVGLDSSRVLLLIRAWQRRKHSTDRDELSLVHTLAKVVFAIGIFEEVDSTALELLVRRTSRQGTQPRSLLLGAIRSGPHRNWIAVLHA